MHATIISQACAAGIQSMAACTASSGAAAFSRYAAHNQESFRREGGLTLRTGGGPAQVGSDLNSPTAQAVVQMCESGQLIGAVDALTSLAEAQSSVPTSLLYRVIQKCGAEKNLVLGRRLDDLVVLFGYESDAFLGNHVLRMYACLGRLEDAMNVFRRVARPDAFMWFSIISAQAKYGKPSQAIQLYQDMRRSSGAKPNNHIFVAALQACAKAKDVESGRLVHADIVESGIQPDFFVSSCLVDMYAKCGFLEDARKSFDSLPSKNVAVWNAMIHGYAEHGLGDKALALYDRMGQEGLILASSVTFVCLLKACASAGELEQGRKLHSQIVERGFLGGDVAVGVSLIDMYAKCGQLEDARRVFDRLATRNVVAWNAMMNGYAEHGFGEQALTLYERMEQEGLASADRVTFVCLLKACASAGALQQGRQLHSQVVKRGLLGGDIVMGNCLVNMYIKCGQLDDARRVFDRLSTRDVVAWNAMINGYAQQGLVEPALALYERMEQEGLVSADGVTFVCLLKACASAGSLHQGRQLHLQIVERGLLEGCSNTAVGVCLVDMYAKCGQLEDARQVFDRLERRDDVVAWNALIHGYAEHGYGEEALALYRSMEQEGRVLPNSVTFVCVLKACACAGALQEGRQVHLQILERGLLEGDLVMGVCLVDMYAKCGQLVDARKVFNSLSTKDVVAWSAMINAYAEHGSGEQALALYQRMEQEGVVLANRVTFVGLLKACASAGALQQGRQLHMQMRERGLLEGDEVVGVGLVDMYAKCGQLGDARRVLDSLSTRNVVAWNAMINGYGKNNQSHMAIACFEEMLGVGVQPDDTTFTCLLVACSHEGLVSQGRRYFEAMVKEHGLNPTNVHHACMVDLLGRAGHLDEAEKVLSAECADNAVALTSLLNACTYHGDLERGTRCFQRLVELGPEEAGAYLLMATAYAGADRWADVGRVERLRKLAGASKKRAVAGIEVDRRVQTFVVGDDRGDVWCKARSTNAVLKEEGEHAPQTALVLKPLSEQEKEEDLCGHAEKLALAYGLLNTPDGTPLLVTKNLRMCGDCHSATAVLSRVEKRDIVVRDAHRVHRFEAGSCSCKGRC